MDNFTASNGTEVNQGLNGSLGVYLDSVTGFTLTGQSVQALREYFEHEEDKRLNRWRWPEKPEFVVYRDSEALDCVYVFDESDPEAGSVTIWRGSDLDWPYFQPAAQAYFKAHPEPKPWHAAKPNELWELRVQGSLLDPEVYRMSHEYGETAIFRPVNNPQRVLFRCDSPDIVDATRIYPIAKEG